MGKPTYKELEDALDTIVDVLTDVGWVPEELEDEDEEEAGDR